MRPIGMADGLPSLPWQAQTQAAMGSFIETVVNALAGLLAAIAGAVVSAVNGCSLRSARSCRPDGCPSSSSG